jgi:hypothetical protein
MKRAVTSLALILATTAPGVAEACSCPIEPLEELVPRLAVLFDGKVDGPPTRIAGDSADNTPRDLYQFTVHRVWKGDVGPSFAVAYPPPQGANCGVTLKPGNVLVIGAHLMRGRPAQANSCTYMNLNRPTLDAVRELGPPRLEHRR